MRTASLLASACAARSASAFSLAAAIAAFSSLLRDLLELSLTDTEQLLLLLIPLLLLSAAITVALDNISPIANAKAVYFLIFFMIEVSSRFQSLSVDFLIHYTPPPV
ncbi:hypothetical protein IMSAG025_00070 [Muribaculaceae bacterium]|nr:hypothetical protein IMSAG025_00070 [Muribaculaceae bacterium]